MAPSLMCKLGVDERGRGGERERVCYVLDEDGKEKKVSVSENLTHILRNLHGNSTCYNVYTYIHREKYPNSIKKFTFFTE